MQKIQGEPRPGRGRLLWIWLRIAFEAFGGGASANNLIRHVFVDKHGWISEDAYIRYRDLAALTPGSNLLSLVILIGRKLGGWQGVVVSLLGMILPGASITLLFTVGFGVIQHTLLVKLILYGLIPATAGTSFYQVVRFAWPLLKFEHAESIQRLIASIVIILLCTVAIMVFKLPVVPVVLISGAVGAFIFRSEPIHKDQFKERDQEVVV